MTPEKFDELANKITGIPYNMVEIFQQVAYELVTDCHVDTPHELMELCIKVGLKVDVDINANCKSTLLNKSKEYAMNGDRLWNFKYNYSFMCQDPKENLIGYMRKHLASCMDYLTRLITFEDKEKEKAFVLEKFGDVYNYCVLLYALIHEDNQ